MGERHWETSSSISVTSNFIYDWDTFVLIIMRSELKLKYLGEFWSEPRRFLSLSPLLNLRKIPTWDVPTQFALCTSNTVD
jgi:hypothetical protein